MCHTVGIVCSVRFIRSLWAVYWNKLCCFQALSLKSTFPLALLGWHLPRYFLVKYSLGYMGIFRVHCRMITWETKKRMKWNHLLTVLVEVFEKNSVPLWRREEERSKRTNFLAVSQPTFNGWTWWNGRPSIFFWTSSILRPQSRNLSSFFLAVWNKLQQDEFRAFPSYRKRLS